MATKQTNPQVDAFLSRQTAWRAELNKLRAIVLACGLHEDFKWKHPCYTIDGRNVVLIHGFKDYCALLFMKGALLHDTAGILVQQTANVQSGRQIRFTSLGDITALEPVLTAYIQEAIDVETAGLTVAHKTTADYVMPDELQAKFAELPALKAAFEALTPGRQRAYLLYFAAPKLSQTRAARIDKYTDRILDGLGLHN